MCGLAKNFYWLKEVSLQAKHKCGQILQESSIFIPRGGKSDLLQILPPSCFHQQKCQAFPLSLVLDSWMSIFKLHEMGLNNINSNYTKSCLNAVKYASVHCICLKLLGIKRWIPITDHSQIRKPSALLRIRQEELISPK
ncbi:hypothetical protein AVEN_23672-1 [Araneus ventricosus]|uniref:Uncharacterized protein n=1 Tax=Araneus ventricosus TaxID=182803 RepID=A0A4Y2BI49_ARAVE|nr:hypothetical protein AVEN_23672-1 [Araneus ventricosus]